MYSSEQDIIHRTLDKTKFTPHSDDLRQPKQQPAKLMLPLYLLYIPLTNSKVKKEESTHILKSWRMVLYDISTQVQVLYSTWFL
jgi:hypothetical protein